MNRTAGPVFNARRHPSSQQRGVAMVVALIMLLVISMTSVTVMRGALNADMVVNNVRTQMVAEQAARIAMRYCEREVVKAAPAITVYDAAAAPAPAHWSTLSNWVGGTAKASAVPESLMVSDYSAYRSGKRPQCLAEKSALTDGTVVYVVTARGFSPDFMESGSGQTVAGAVVWLQSTLTLK